MATRLLTPTIWKFNVELHDSFTRRIPPGARFLTLQNQDGQPKVWAFVSEEAEAVNRYFHVAGTGWTLPESSNDWEYIGTWQDQGFVWHLFVEPEARDGN